MNYSGSMRRQKVIEETQETGYNSWRQDEAGGNRMSQEDKRNKGGCMI